MRYWFDSEFHDDGTTIELISIGVVSEDGREYYAESCEYAQDRASPWIQKHVLPQLRCTQRPTRKIIRDEIARFFSDPQDVENLPSSPEFWAYCGEYDWIVLRQLFGDLMAWPRGWPVLAMDVEQWRLQLNAPNFRPQALGKHNALADARYTRSCWQELTSFSAIHALQSVAPGNAAC